MSACHAPGGGAEQLRGCLLLLGHTGDPAHRKALGRLQDGNRPRPEADESDNLVEQNNVPTG